MAQCIKNLANICEDADWIPALAQWVKGSSIAVSRGVGCRRSSDPTLPWLWYRLAATALIQPLAWKLPNVMGAALKKINKKVSTGALRHTGTPCFQKHTHIYTYIHTYIHTCAPAGPCVFYMQDVVLEFRKAASSKPGISHFPELWLSPPIAQNQSWREVASSGLWAPPPSSWLLFPPSVVTDLAAPCQPHPNPRKLGKSHKTRRTT